MPNASSGPISDGIRQAIKEAVGGGRKVASIAADAGIAASQLYRFLDDDPEKHRDLSLAALDRIARTLGVGLRKGEEDVVVVSPPGPALNEEPPPTPAGDGPAALTPGERDWSRGADYTPSYCFADPRKESSWYNYIQIDAFLEQLGGGVSSAVSGCRSPGIRSLWAAHSRGHRIITKERVQFWEFVSNVALKNPTLLGLRDLADRFLDLARLVPDPIHLGRVASVLLPSDLDSSLRWDAEGFVSGVEAICLKLGLEKAIDPDWNLTDLERLRRLRGRLPDIPDIDDGDDDWEAYVGVSQAGEREPSRHLSDGEDGWGGQGPINDSGGGDDPEWDDEDDVFVGGDGDDSGGDLVGGPAHQFDVPECQTGSGDDGIVPSFVGATGQAGDEEEGPDKDPSGDSLTTHRLPSVAGPADHEDVDRASAEDGNIEKVEGDFDFEEGVKALRARLQWYKNLDPNSILGRVLNPAPPKPPTPPRPRTVEQDAAAWEGLVESGAFKKPPRSDRFPVQHGEFKDKIDYLLGRIENPEVHRLALRYTKPGRKAVERAKFYNFFAHLQYHVPWGPAIVTRPDIFEKYLEVARRLHDHGHMKDLAYAIDPTDLDLEGEALTRRLHFRLVGEGIHDGIHPSYLPGGRWVEKTTHSIHPKTGRRAILRAFPKPKP